MVLMIEKIHALFRRQGWALCVGWGKQRKFPAKKMDVGAKRTASADI
jgi:hypothetical protein